MPVISLNPPFRIIICVLINIYRMGFWIELEYLCNYNLTPDRMKLLGF